VKLRLNPGPEAGLQAARGDNRHRRCSFFLGLWGLAGVVAMILEVPKVKVLEECENQSPILREMQLPLYTSLGQYRKRQTHLRDRRQKQIGAPSVSAMWPPAPGFSPQMLDLVNDQVGREQPWLYPPGYTQR